MTPGAPPRPFPVRAHEARAVLARWPADRPLLLIHSGGAGRWSRWTVAAAPGAWMEATAATADTVLRRLDPKPAPRSPGVPFTGGWIGVLDYELGAALEPAVAGRHHDPDRTVVQLARCDDGLVLDHATGRWTAFGSPPLYPADLAGSTAADADRLEDRWPRPPRLGRWTSRPTPAAYRAAVARTLEYIAAGDIFQANIARVVSADFHGVPRRLAARALARSAAWYGAYLELPEDRYVVSMSPELFLSVDGPTRRAVTRPIKGTRPTRVPTDELRDSAKDAAELHMIVDLMRNDLGRVSELGSVEVPRARTIESHPTVHHGVGEVHAILRADVRPVDLLRATFPPGSITGAPKIRAMQIIDELEPGPRGAYCGAVGWFGDDGAVALNVAIRTIELQAGAPSVFFDAERPVEGRLRYGIGAGIVADSDPDAELHETDDKAAVLGLALEG